MASGLVKWATGIRIQMMDDPGRKQLADDIHLNGFLWLEQYLDNILAGPTDEPLIELVKTPGRRKDSPKKTRAAVAANVSKMRLIDMAAESSFMDKENTPTRPAAVRIKSPKVLSPRRDPFKPISGNDNRQNMESLIDFSPKTIRTKQILFKPLDETLLQAFAPAAVPAIPAPDVSGPKKPSLLDTITDTTPKDIQMDKSLPNIGSKKQSLFDTQVDTYLPNIGAKKQSLFTAIADMTPKDIQMDTSLPNTGAKKQSPFDTTPNDTEMDTTESLKPPPAELTERSLEENPFRFIQTPRTTTSKPPSPTTQLNRKVSVPALPALPSLSPLRKSTRQPSVPTQRGSWLVKARDDTTTTRFSALDLGAAPFHGHANRVKFMPKRGSAAMEGAEEREAKVPKLDGVLTARQTSELIGKMNESETATATTKISTGTVEHQVVVAKTVEQVVKIAPQPEATREKSKPPPITLPPPSEVIVSPMPTPTPTPTPTPEEPTGMLDMLKKQVQGFGTKFAKTVSGSKSLSGAAATAAAEAKAAAEARLAQKQKEEEHDKKTPAPSVVPSMISTPGNELPGAFPTPRPQRAVTREESIVDVAPLQFTSTRQSREESVARQSLEENVMDVRPPSALDFSSAPPTQSNDSTSEAETMEVTPVFEALSNTIDSMSSRKPHSPIPSTIFHPESSSYEGMPPPTIQSTFSSVFSTQSSQFSQVSSIFDQPVGEMGELGGTQESVFSQPLPPLKEQERESLDMAPVPARRNDDTMHTSDLRVFSAPKDREMTGDFVMVDEFADVEDEPEPEPEPRGLKKQASSSQIFSQEKSLLQKAFGGSKKAKPEVKSIQLAAVAAKKQQEEADKKAARLKEMESRRQQVMQKKQDEERSKAAELERKNREDLERRKRERDDTEKRKPLPKKNQLSDDETKKPRPVSRLAKPALTASTSQATLHTTTSTTNLAKTYKMATTSSQPTIKLVQSSSNLKAMAVAVEKPAVPAKTAGLVTKFQQAKLLQQQQHQLQVEQVQAMAATEHIELPAIDSEYSDDEDHERIARKIKARPDWAQSPEVVRALEDQRLINPDSVFGDIMPLRMQDMFKQKGRFRNRTSSANWVTTGDQVTEEETAEYARRMGYV